ncbi:hypothetical protein BDV12DRAFT_197303 [Aspergillus spectabilis]
MEPESTPRNPRPHQKRVSNACVPCRTRHMKCDSETPICSRCQEEGSECVYMKSRRGGGRRNKDLEKQDDMVPPRRATILPAAQIKAPPAALYSVHRLGYERDSPESNDGDLLGLYYSFFHAAHPCVLPQWALRIRAALYPASVEVLLPVLEYIGSLYSQSKAPSAPLERNVLQTFARLRTSARDPSPFDVQAILLYSVAVYWCDDIPRSLELLDDAIKMAVRIGMEKAGFDITFGEGDPVLQESWRRTWWVIYLTATHMAGSTCSFPSKVDGIAMSVRLPCEEELYEAGDITCPPSIEDYETREFQSQAIEFSSFAELIGIARSIELFMSEGVQLGPDGVNRLVGNADTSILAWLLLLPASKQSLVNCNGTVDQLLFRAHMLIYTYIVDLNRQFSTLHHTALESLSRRTPRPPPASLSLWQSNDFNLTFSPLNPSTTAHTAKVLTAIEKMNTLLTLPIHLTLHTPFIICMIANTAIAHLAAYKWVYGYQERRIERGRIRLVVAVLKGLGMYWPLGRRTYKEVVAVARDVLGGGVGDSPQGLDGGDVRGSGGGEGHIAGTEMEMAMNMEMGYPGSEFESAMRLLSAGMGAFEGVAPGGSEFSG